MCLRPHPFTIGLLDYIEKAFAVITVMSSPHKRCVQSVMGTLLVRSESSVHLGSFSCFVLLQPAVYLSSRSLPLILVHDGGVLFLKAHQGHTSCLRNITQIL